MFSGVLYPVGIGFHMQRHVFQLKNKQPTQLNNFITCHVKCSATWTKLQAKLFKDNALAFLKSGACLFWAHACTHTHMHTHAGGFSQSSYDRGESLCVCCLSSDTLHVRCEREDGGDKWWSCACLRFWMHCGEDVRCISSVCFQSWRSLSDFYAWPLLCVWFVYQFCLPFCLPFSPHHSVWLAGTERRRPVMAASPSASGLEVLLSTLQVVIHSDPPVCAFYSQVLFLSFYKR